MKPFLKRIWIWMREHVVMLPVEKDGRTDSKSGAVGFRWKF